MPVLGSPIPILGMKVKREQSLDQLVMCKHMKNYINEKVFVKRS